MANCPKCGGAQDWWRLLQFDKTQLMVCQQCGSKLALDSERTTILLGGGLALMLFPESGLLPFNAGLLWYFSVFVVYMPFYLHYLKLNLVTDDDLNIAPNQEVEFVSYAEGRRKRQMFGNILFWIGLLLFFAGMSISSAEFSETVSVIGLVSMIVGLGVLALTRCPFCKKITLRIPFGDGGRCMNCHREIDIND